MDTTNLRVRASRVGAMLGVDPRCTRLALYHEMRGSLPPIEDNEVLKEGRYFEDAIARIAAEKFNFDVLPAELNGAPIHWVDGSISGHPDRLFRDHALNHYGILEIKNTMFGGGGQGWGDGETDLVPDHYYYQVMAYQGLLAANVEPLLHLKGKAGYAILAARLTGGTRKFVISYDPEIYAKIQLEAAAFVDLVITGNAPDPESEEDHRQKWLVTPKKRVEAHAEFVAWANAAREKKAAIKQLETEVSDLMKLMLGYAQDAEEVVKDGLTIATLGSNRKFNEQRFLLEQPQLAAQFQRLDTTRLNKEAKSIYESYMERPTNPLEQTRVIRIKEVKS